MKAIGYWAFEVNVVDDSNFSMVSEDEQMERPTALNTEVVYKKVTVDTSENKAYYPQEDIGPHADMKNLRMREGRVYVPITQVHKSPPNDARPFHKVKE